MFKSSNSQAVPLPKELRFNREPSIIAVRGEPERVLMSFVDNQQLTRQQRNIADTLALTDAAGTEAEIEFAPPQVNIESKPADFS